MEVKVSVVVPVYKIPNFALEGCINSLLNQDYSNCEFILVDDGSPDNCGQICDSYAQKDKRIKVVHKQNAGVSEARNTGIIESTGDYIMFVDGDDCIHPRAVSIMMAAALRNNLDIVLCDYNRFYSIDAAFKTIQGDDCELSIFTDEDEKVALRKKCLHEDNVFNIRFNGAPWGKLFSSKLIKQSNFLFDSSLIRSQDNHFNFVVFGSAKQIGYIHSKLYYYRQLPGSSVNRYRANLFDISNTYIDKISETVNNTSSPSIYNETLKYVKIEKMLELITNYSRSPKEDKNNAIKYIREAHKRWLNDLSIHQINSMNLNLNEKVRMYLIALEKYRTSMLLSCLLFNIKRIINKYRRK